MMKILACWIRAKNNATNVARTANVARLVKLHRAHVSAVTLDNHQIVDLNVLSMPIVQLNWLVLIKSVRIHAKDHVVR